MLLRTIDDITETLTAGGKDSRRCTVLVGAGCSKSAGIPTALEIVREIQRTYRAAYARATLKDYPNCMAALEIGVRRDLIGRYVDQAKINWAHIALAQLIAGGHVDRVLTTNFDPLVTRACSLINIFPAVYDFAASHVFKPDQVSKQAIFHLHGQRDGFVLLNTDKEVRKHRKHIRPVFEDAHRGRIWIVVGYSGENDPVFDLLASTRSFEYGLYWVGRGHSPSKHVAERLLLPEKGAYFLGGWDADDFFVSLAQKLGCFPPTFLRQPFTYLKNNLARLSDYKAPHETGRIDITSRVRQELDTIIQSHESQVSAEYHFLAGEYDLVLRLLRRQSPRKLSARDRNVLAWTYLIQGNQLHDAARGRESEKLHRQAIEKFRCATKISKSIGAAYYNWGNVLFDLSVLKRLGAPEVVTPAAEKLLQYAIVKYKLAIAVDPTITEAHNNWGNALADLARAARPEDEATLLREASTHYKKSAPYSEVPDVDYCNWGKVLHDLARKTRAKRTFFDAFEKFRIAAKYNPNNYSVFLSWGHALSDAARFSKSDTLLQEAFGKYRRASVIRSNDTASLHSWEGELRAFAARQTGLKRKRLLKQAASIRQKLSALQIKIEKGREKMSTQ
jgi:tetratricopeptide (TPR) repeat protein